LVALFYKRSGLVALIANSTTPMQTDKLAYLIFKNLPQGFFSLIGRNPNDAKKYQFKSVEIKETAFRIDAVFQPIKNDDFTYFVEAQFHEDEHFYARFFSEIFLYLRQFEVFDWQGIAIYPSREVEVMKISKVRPYLKLLDIDIVKRIYLDELLIEKSNPALLFKLLIEPEQSAPELARNIVEDSRVEENSSLYLNIVQQILFYKFKEKSYKEIMKMLGIEEEILRETRAFQEILTEGKLEGKIEGKIETVPLLRRLGLSDEQIAKELGVPLDLVQRVPKASS
jgi:predicted transposase/invertase (TIGR01784 family)